MRKTRRIALAVVVQIRRSVVNRYIGNGSDDYVRAILFKVLEFGLGPSFFYDSCPSQHCIRTRSSFFPRPLSESPPHSDSLFLFPLPPVRITLSFRLAPPFSLDNCPNHPPIQTLSFFFPRPLSESPSLSDSLLLFPLTPVRITLSFCKCQANDVHF